jgi:hypothetical protein
MAIFIRTDTPLLMFLPSLLASENKTPGFTYSAGASPQYLRASSYINLTGGTDNTVYSKTLSFFANSDVRIIVAVLIRTNTYEGSFTLTVKLIVDGTVVASHSFTDSIYSNYYLLRPFNIALSCTIDVGTHTIQIAVNPSLGSYLHDLMVVILGQDTIIDGISEYNPSYSEYTTSNSYPSSSSASNTEVEVANISFSLPKNSMVVIVGVTMFSHKGLATMYGRLYVDGVLVKELSTNPSQSTYTTYMFVPMMSVMTLTAGSHTASLRVYSSLTFSYWLQSSHSLLNYVALSQQ